MTLPQRPLPTLLLTLLLAAGCGQSDSPPPTTLDTGSPDVEGDAGGEGDVDARPDRVVADILFPTETFVVQLDTILRPEAQAVNAAGEELDVRVSFESSDPAVMEISSAGIAVGRAPGVVTLTARAGEVQKEWPARVVSAPVASVDVVPANYTLRLGEAVEYVAVARDAGDVVIDDAGQPTWTTTDMGVASIDTRGIARALSVGTVEVVATIEGVEGRATLEIVEAPVDAVAISPRNAPAIYPLGSFELDAMALDEEGDPMPWVQLSWASSDTSVATVDGGVVTGVAPGRAMISASVGDIVDEVEIEVIFSVQEVFAGEEAGCVISGEQLYCFGQNSQGQLGVGDLNERLAPVRLGYGPGLRDVSLGGGHGCLVNAAGELYCWGRNDYGQVGRPGLTTELSPQRVDGRTYLAVSAGAEHTCAVEDTGDIYCWGRNDERQAGHSGASANIPRKVGGGHDFVLVAAGSRHSCGVTSDDFAYCWGANDRGQLGDGTTTATPSEVPAFISGGYTFAYLEAGEDFSCGLSPSGLPVCWGAGERGQIGNNATADVNVPRTLALPVGSGLSALTVGRDHACGLFAGQALCWGAFEDGRLGRALSDDQSSPQAASFAQRFVQIDAGDGVTCGWTEDLEIFCWGQAPGAGAVPAAVEFEDY
ncbi:hypothetical protein EA187_19405 [Lujinxingia sediminis]|uniref:BIG2 domain-containing protein n=1 Tax=Lujinxingia sediminis TaxID=2480984 RepID=A0ABY0CN79_9DELT|nr:Ig-like domain-containing protein [Lujinxingia sediminis]RVU41069.1 hypothetical protein EA187_19405 [Lujinxingia sediminis]